MKFTYNNTTYQIWFKYPDEQHRVVAIVADEGEIATHRASATRPPWKRWGIAECNLGNNTPPPTDAPRLIESARRELRRYAELLARGDWGRAGAELEVVQRILDKPGDRWDREAGRKLALARALAGDPAEFRRVAWEAYHRRARGGTDGLD